MVTVRELSEPELEWANACYAAIDFVPSSPHDFIAIAEVDGEKAGLGRIVPIEPDVGELGGMFVFPHYRGQAVARSIVDFLMKRSTRSRLYCIPFKHLEPFYRSCGFAPAPDRDVFPAAVAAKLAWCERQYPDPVCVLCRTTQ